ncbi:MAG: hypothetical protein KGD60_06170 [Candidatus Thorarchaeota archaeon]|nr:hypothetical protein [Candidatus Thorarchaeota archaeon]
MKLEPEIYNIYPIAWIAKSKVLMDYVYSVLVKERTTEHDKEFLVADFASGEHDRVPSFFLRILPELLTSDEGPKKRTTVYSTDLHALRLDSLMGKLEESSLLEDVRVVLAKLETMDEDAHLRPDMLEYLEANLSSNTWLDTHLKEQKFIPPNTFDIGVLNNDIVGYLQEYYTEYSNAIMGLQKVHKVLKDGALLVVTMPCSLYVIDNVQILESLGFEFLEGQDIVLSNGSVTLLNRFTEPQTMSRLGHYTFLIFIRK